MTLRQIAVLKEMDGRGPFCSLVMAVTVFKDVVVIIAYALNMELISAASHPAAQGGGLSLLTLTLPLLSVVLSMATGACGGMLLSYLLAPGNFTRMGAVSGYRLRAALLLGVATVVFQTAYHFDAEPLLACVTMGLALANHGRSPERSPAEREELLGLLGAIMAATNVPFFALLGASIKLPAVANMFGVAVIVFVVRLAAIFSGCWTGCIATGAPPEYRRVFWMSMITQSGVAMGLARVAGARFPDWGPHFQTLMVSIVVCNLTIGPPLFRYSLIQMGEARVGQSKQGPGVALPSPKPLEVKVLLSTEGGEPAEKEDQTPDQRAHSL